MHKLVGLLTDDAGSAAAEYAIILAIVGIGIAIAAGSMKRHVVDSRDQASEAATSASTAH
jgi:pilus assembly protein Flp/PilA